MKFKFKFKPKLMRIELPPSLSSFAYGLSGSLFAKSIFVTFQSCRFLRVILDQKELRRIGSPNFRPDMQIKRLSFEHVYHLASWRS